MTVAFVATLPLGVAHAQATSGVEENPYAITEDNPYARGDQPDTPYARPFVRPTTTPPPDARTTAATAVAPEPDEPTEPAAEADAGAVAPESDADDDRPPRVHAHALGVTFHSVSFATESGLGFSLLGVGVHHTYFVGRKWGFATRGSVAFPMSARMAGGQQDFRISLREPYEESRLALDLHLMAARRFVLTEDLALITGVGIHVQSFRLLGAQYLPIEAITGGFGAMARIDYLLGDVFSLGADLSLGLDPLDFVDHENRATFTFPISFGLSIGARR